MGILDIGIGILKRVFTKKKGKRARINGAGIAEIVESVGAIREPGERLNWEVVLAYVVRMVVLVGLTALILWVAGLMGVTPGEFLEYVKELSKSVPG